MNRQDVHQKVAEYQQFLETTLRPQLDTARQAKRVVDDEIQEYQELLDRLEQQWNEISTMTVDLGWNKAYCEAQIQSKNATIFVDVGMGFHVELTTAEAVEFSKKRIKFLQTKLKDCQSQLRKVEEHVATAEDILDHLTNEASSLP